MLAAEDAPFSIVGLFFSKKTEISSRVYAYALEKYGKAVYSILKTYQSNEPAAG